MGPTHDAPMATHTTGIIEGKIEIKTRCFSHLTSSGCSLQTAFQLRVARLEVAEDVAASGLESASIAEPPVDHSSATTPILVSMLHSSSVLASMREERVQKAVSVDHHEPGDGRQRHGCYTLSAAQKATLWLHASFFVKSWPVWV